MCKIKPMLLLSIGVISSYSSSVYAAPIQVRNDPHGLYEYIEKSDTEKDSWIANLDLEQLQTISVMEEVKHGTIDSDFGFPGHTGSDRNPADPSISVGPNHIVATVNDFIRFYTKDGTVIFDQDLDLFFESVSPGEGFVVDPATVFDPYSQRFIISTIYFFNTVKETVAIAISDNDDPTGKWKFAAFDATGLGVEIDFPTLGFDSKAIYVGVKFTGFPNTGSWIFMFNKSELMQGLCPKVNTVKISNQNTAISGTRTIDPDAPAQYFLTHISNNGGNKVNIEAIQNPLSTPTRDTFALTIPNWTPQNSTPQKGSTTPVKTIPSHFIRNAEYRDGHLWFTHGVRGPFTNQHIIRWYQVAMNGWPLSGNDPILVQIGDINLGKNTSGNPISTMYPDLALNDNGDVMFIFNRVAADEFISVARAFRHISDPPGSVQGVEILMTSTTPALIAGAVWGDYSTIAVDPSDPLTFWSHGMYRTNIWRTWISATNLAPGPSIPTTSVEGLIAMAIIMIISCGVIQMIKRKRSSDSLNRK